MITLYDYFRSSACYRVRIALNLKGLTHQLIPVHLINQGGEQFLESYRTINPQSLVPTLKDHQNTITQSIAIIEYLEETYSTPSIFATNEPYQKALIRAFALSIACDIHPLNNLRVLKYLSNEFKVNDEQKSLWYQHWIYKGLLALEKQLTSYQFTGDFCFGQTPTLADICLIPQLYNARRFQCDLNDFPNLTRIDANCQRLAAFQKAVPVETVN